MGTTLVIGCDCNKKDLEFGIGFMNGDPEKYRDTTRQMKAGRYGEDEKNLIENVKYVVVDTEWYIFWCRKCGHLTTQQSLDLYIPKDMERAKTFLTGEEVTVEEWAKFPGWWPDEYGYDNDCFRIKEHIHICSKCKQKMEQIEEEDLLQKTCPKCHKKYTLLGSGIWD